VKKQRMARDRTTGLKTVKTPNSATESSLPTPDITGGEEADGDEVDQIATANDDLDDDFEAEMMAELEKGDWEQDGGGSGAG
jgi:RNA polymerase II subunit A-like phosphatase